MAFYWVGPSDGNNNDDNGVDGDARAASISI